MWFEAFLLLEKRFKRREIHMTGFYLTRMGKTFYDHTMPTIAKELARLSNQLERIATALETKTNEHKETANAEIED